MPHTHSVKNTNFQNTQYSREWMSPGLPVQLSQLLLSIVYLYYRSMTKHSTGNFSIIYIKYDLCIRADHQKELLWLLVKINTL